MEEPIAIIGASCRLPGAPDVDAFWRLLIEGRDAVTEIPDDRWNKAALLHPERGQRGKAYTFAAGVLGDVSGFDPAFFGISPREATQMDPQQRLLLELAYEAIEDAALDSDRLRGEPVGVFIGGSSWDYLNLNVGDPSTTDAYSMIGVTLSILSNRISYAFDLRGPSFTVDTACSSSLVALHQACEAIRGGEIGMAMVGGVSLLLAPQSFVGFCAASMLSPKGHCHAFDARADGYVRAEGGCMVMLKPLGAALAAGDPIRAVIRGTGVNSDGRTSGLSLPNKAAQAALLTHVYDRFAIDPAELVYVEAHGTGTPAGDPIEAGALGSVLGRGRSAPLPIGSVKTNVGHLEAASGMAGLIKAMLVAERGTIPPSLHCETPNPNIPFSELGLTLAPEAIVLPDDGRRRLVGLNSFGFGGTNAHAVLEAPDPTSAPVAENNETLPPLLLSARSAGALKALAATWRARIADADPTTLPALVRGVACGRTQHKKRLVVPGGPAAAMLDALDAFLADKATVAVATGDAVPSRLGFVFSGNGSQWAGMAADAMAGSPAFREALAEADAALQPWLGWSVADALADPDPDGLRNTDVAQPLLFAVQVALVLALRQHGVEADACMGHSVGEVAAAWASGALDLDAAARVIAARSSAQQQQHGVGAMGVLGLDAEASAAILATAPLAGCGVEVAAHNSAQATTVAGSTKGMDALEAEAKAKGWRFTRLDLDYAFHSAAMDPIAARLATDLDGLLPGLTTVPFVSTVAGVTVEGRTLDAGYWWRNVRAPVLFAEAARAMVAEGIRLFVELGPHPVVQSYLTDALRAADKEGRVLPSLSRRPAKGDPIAALAARIHAAGGDIRHADAFMGPAVRRGLPGYPWQRERFWVPRTPEATDLVTVGFDHPLLGQRQGDQPVEWRRHIALETLPWLADHVVGGAAVVPAAALIEMALAAARERHPKAAALDLLDVEIGRALVLEPHVMREVRFRVGSGAGDFELASRPRLTEEAWIVHMAGRIGESDVAPASRLDPVEGVIERRVDATTLYALAHGMGLDYGPAFRVVTAIDVLGDTQAMVRLGQVTALGDGLLLPPNRVDGAMQGLLALAADRLGGDNGVVPWRFGRIQLLAPAGAIPTAARLDVTRVGPRSIRADIALLDADGAVVARFGECWFVQVTLGRSADMEDMLFHPAIVASNGGQAVAWPALLAPTAESTPSEARLLADAYATTVAAETIRGLAASEPDFLPQALIRQGAVAPGSRVVLDRLLRWLAADDLAEQGGDGVWSLRADDLPPSDAILRTWLFDNPRAIADTALLALASEALPALLEGGPDAAPALPDALWDQFLTDSPSSIAAAEALVARVQAVAAAWPEGRPLRVLEIGARRGALTRRLLRAVSHPDLALVAATNSDEHHALAALLGGTPRVRAMAWPVGAGEGSFDLIVGMHALSLGDWGPSEIGALAAMLAPEGALLLAEPEPSRTWQLLRPFAPALIDAARRVTAIEEAGFVDAALQPLGAGLWPTSLIAARGPDRAMQPASMPSGIMLFAEAGADAEALAAVLGDAIEARQALGSLPETIAIWRASPEASMGCCLVIMPGETTPLPQILMSVAALATLPATDAPLPVTICLRGRAAGDARAAAVMGAWRVLANEAPHIACRLVRLDPDLSVAQAAAHAAAEIGRPDGEGDIAWSAHGRHVPRIRTGLPPVANDAAALRLTVQRPGLLGSLGWAEADVALPGPGELAIKVEAAALNFRDVMWAMGLLPDEALLDGFAGPTLGLECAGIVTAVGDGVTTFAPGARVMAFAPAALSTHTVTAAHAVMRMPAGMDFAAAATVPVAFLTVAYALGHLGRIEAGETVLVHGGAGGVGLAAIQYAKHRGARVIATAGSPTKRALLRRLGVDAVLDSRSLAFADEVMRLTDGVGVDAVLNSLSGEAMRRSLGLVKPFGRFLELGKRDFYENSAVGLRPFRHNVSYFGIDADQLPLKRPALAAALFGEISDLFAAGALRPLPHRLYDYADAEDAFRLMQASGHIGKIVLAPGAAWPMPLRQAATFAADPDGAYVVTGGLDGFGREAARWLARSGARHLALLSRRGPAAPGAAETLAAFAADGIDARAYAVDVADEAALDKTLAAIRSDQAPIAGVIHAAVAMDDALLAQLDADRFERALRPKLAGAEALDRLTRTDPIGLFLLFSSVTTPLGNPGQGNYVAANAAIEAVAERRHAEGLPALAVQWGPIGDAGYLAREHQVSDMLARMLGGDHLTAERALDMLPALIDAGAPVIGLAGVRWGALAGRLPLLASPLFAEMEQGGSDEAAEVDLKELLATCSPEEAQGRVTSMLVEEVARIMKLAPDRVEPQRPLAELGMDSLMAVELRLAVEQRFGISIPLLALSEGATLTAMGGRIVRSLGAPAEAGAPDAAQELMQRLARHEGGIAGPADGATAPDEPGLAAAAATMP
ncbi:type I polyketide synthase [Sphingomonas nostoxanthinifaciens]|uniref:type I polyketide synthase n=1 Tax=Sphingomonas nostoxanthinifaciens TaxID=2872652 RepID=UPI001CC1D8EB|nr:type I polyketide synthase [Sphingomonas nostoxanthinifaciens]UAK25007.1 SDR family NAD(P)-dependent oxidoreductase [Sphingomonas nostoxanthinifaciens]